MPTTQQTGKLRRICEAIKVLESAVHEMVGWMGGPEFWAKMNQRSPLSVQVLKAVSIVSSLNACIVLLEAGYAQEIGALSRSIGDLVEDIIFLEMPWNPQVISRPQRKFIKSFFSGRGFVSRRTIQEHIADNSRVEKNYFESARARSTKLSGYVHGNYGPIMDLYDPEAGSFVMAGIKAPATMDLLLRHVGYGACCGMLAVELVARGMHLGKIESILSVKREALDQEISP